MYRQGDVLLIPITNPTIPTIPPQTLTKAVIARGEATGHDHVLHGRAYYYVNNTVHLLEDGTLSHQLADGSQAEHDPIPLTKGWYEIRHQREYIEPTPTQQPRTRRVRD